MMSYYVCHPAQAQTLLPFTFAILRSAVSLIVDCPKSKYCNLSAFFGKFAGQYQYSCGKLKLTKKIFHFCSSSKFEGIV
jgi:hypothetical protein